jgi:hypothetical protein
VHKAPLVLKREILRTPFQYSSTMTWKHNISIANSWSTVSASSQPPVSLNHHLGSDQSQVIEQGQMAQHEQLENPSTEVNHNAGAYNNKNIGSLEIEGITSDESASWVQRVPWIRIKRDRKQEDGVYLDSLTYAKDSEAIYQGGTMEAERYRSARSDQEILPDEGSRIHRNPSHLSHSSINTRGEDSLANFDESEWTPPDSSYGAAIPVAGWIPKAIRRTIEWTLIALGVAGLAYVIVTTSIRISDETSKKYNGTSTGGTDYSYDGGTGLDDNIYSEYTNDDYATQYSNDDYATQYSNDDYTSSQYTNDDASNYGDYDGNDQYGYYSDGYNNNNNDDVDDYFTDDYFNDR